MLKDCLIVAINLLLIVLVTGRNEKETNNVRHSAINVAVAEHEPSKAAANDSQDQAWQTTTERTLIRVTRLESSTQQPKRNMRQRRQVIEAIQTAGFVINVAKAMQNTESEHDEHEKM